MQFTLKPAARNTGPLGGIRLAGHSPHQWLAELDRLGLSPANVTAYALPCADSEEPWGCLILCDPTWTGLADPAHSGLGRNELCQRVDGLLFIPERAALFPPVTAGELERLLVSRPHFFHPETGLVELVRPVDWSETLALPIERPVTIRRPEPTKPVPARIRSFEVQALSPEATLEKMAAGHFPERQPLENKPLSLAEQVKLRLYRILLGNKNGPPSGMTRLLTQFWSRFSDENWRREAALDLEELQRRNQHTVDRFLTMLRNNPGEALKYAIPLDETGTERGKAMPGELRFTLRWPDWSLLGGGQVWGGGSGVLPDSKYDQLRRQYLETAAALTRQGDYRQAAFVYLKLLKDYREAARILEKGEFFAEAAALWLKYGKDLLQAAVCYEKAHMTEAALELYRTLKQHEKVGDLCTALYRSDEARTAYQCWIDELLSREKYLDAAHGYRQKLHDESRSQETLLKGWRANRDANRCLAAYFDAIASPADLITAMRDVHAAHADGGKAAIFLQVLKHVRRGTPTAEVSDLTTDLAYEVVASKLRGNPGIAVELRSFAPEDEQLGKDIMRFRNRLGR